MYQTVSKCTNFGKFGIAKCQFGHPDRVADNEPKEPEVKK